jgi:hypothetical protein
MDYRAGVRPRLVKRKVEMSLFARDGTGAQRAREVDDGERLFVEILEGGVGGRDEHHVIDARTEVPGSAEAVAALK